MKIFLSYQISRLIEFFRAAAKRTEIFEKKKICGKFFFPAKK
jgi:hypothetical protein